MSYARFGWDGSDVYVYAHVDGGFHCCGCWLNPEGNWHYPDTDAIVAHLREHVAAGHTVPDDCFQRLEDEREMNDGRRPRIYLLPSEDFLSIGFEDTNDTLLKAPEGAGDRDRLREWVQTVDGMIDRVYGPLLEADA